MDAEQIQAKIVKLLTRPSLSEAELTRWADLAEKHLSQLEASPYQKEVYRARLYNILSKFDSALKAARLSNTYDLVAIMDYSLTMFLTQRGGFLQNYLEDFNALFEAILLPFDFGTIPNLDELVKQRKTMLRTVIKALEGRISKNKAFAELSPTVMHNYACYKEFMGDSESMLRYYSARSKQGEQESMAAFQQSLNARWRQVALQFLMISGRYTNSNQRERYRRSSAPAGNNIQDQTTSPSSGLDAPDVSEEPPSFPWGEF